MVMIVMLAMIFGGKYCKRSDNGDSGDDKVIVIQMATSMVVIIVKGVILHKQGCRRRQR